MAEANTKSTAVTAADAGKFNAPHIEGGRVRQAPGTVEVAAADDANSVYRLARVWSGWRLSGIPYWHDSITSLSDSNWGLYDTAKNGGAAVNDNLFGDAIDLSSAATGDALFEALDIANVEKRIWELLGLSADPGKWYDLCVTAVSDPAGAGTISAIVHYVDA